MPVVLRYGKIRFLFYSDDHLPIHIHAIYGNSEASCKIVVSDLAISNNKGFSRKDLTILKKIVKTNEDLITEAWNEFFKR